MTLPNGDVRQFDEGVTGAEIALSISEGLARNALGIFVNEVPFDGTRTLVTYRATTPLADHDRVLVRLLVQGR